MSIGSSSTFIGSGPPAPCAALGGRCVDAADGAGSPFGSGHGLRGGRCGLSGGHRALKARQPSGLALMAVQAHTAESHDRSDDVDAALRTIGTMSLGFARGTR